MPTTVVVGLNGSGNNWTVTFSPSGGAITQSPAAGNIITWSLAGTSGNITAPSGAAITGVNIANGSYSGGAATWTFPGGTTAAQNPGTNNWTINNNANNSGQTSSISFGYTATVNYNNNPYTSADPEIVNNPPSTGTRPDPGMITSPPDEL